MISGFDMLKNSQFDMIRSFINGTLLSGYGIIETVLEDGDVLVDSMFQTSSNVMRMTCKYLTLSASSVSTSVEPTVGDHVLILALQHKDKDMVTSPEPIEVFTLSGYTLYSCIAIPFGVFNSDSVVQLSVTKDGATVTTEKPVAVSAEKIMLNGDSKAFVTHAELDAKLQTFISALNSHVHLCAGSGSPSAVPTNPMSLDISDSATTTVLTGG